MPRLYHLWRKTGIVQSFAEYIDNLFRPVFECTLNPESNPKLATFLEHLVAIDSVDDESGYGR